MNTPLLPRLETASVMRQRPAPIAADALADAERIVAEVRAEGPDAVQAWGERLGDLEPGSPWILGRADLQRALDGLDRDTRKLLERCAERVARFAQAQLAGLRPLDQTIEGGRAGVDWIPIEAAGCYVPGGRYPLPSTALMTALVAKTAGVERVWVASPRPQPTTLAAAALAGADGLIRVGGAQAVAALAFGAGPVPAVDLIAGPGNRWVTAAKKVVWGEVGVDMPAGPSELVVLADAQADPALIAADLLAQAEHDPEARPLLVTTEPRLPSRVEAHLAEQLADLPSASTARRALANGGSLVAGDLEEACVLVDALAPEHLELLVADPRGCARRIRHAGAVFLGPASAEVFGDYGAGPNHVLPTGGAARYGAGLSVMTFLRPRTWLQLEPCPALESDAAELARIEGLEAHARAADLRSRRT